MLISLQLRQPMRRPHRHRHQRNACKQNAGHRSSSCQVRKCDGKANLWLGHRYRKREREKGSSHNQRCPLGSDHRRPVRIREEYQQPQITFARQSEGQQTRAKTEKSSSRYSCWQPREGNGEQNRGEWIRYRSGASVTVRVAPRKQVARCIDRPVEVRRALMKVVEQKPAEKTAGTSQENRNKNPQAHGSPKLYHVRLQ